MSELTLLLYVMAMVTGTAVISWLAVALPMKIATGASLRFALANLFFLFSVALTLQRTSVASFWFWPVADLLGIVAIVVLRSGTRKLFKQPATTMADSIGLLLLCLLYLPQSYDGHSARFYGIAYSLAMAIVTALTCRDVFRAARQEFSAQTAASIAWPFGAVALAMLLRASLIASNAKAISLDAGTNPVDFDSTYSMLAYVFLLLILNLTLFACVITRLIAKLRNYSERDHLTGLLNRRAFESRLNTERLRSERSGNEFSLLLFDIDHFKQINDQFGHSAGDLALRHVARRIKDALRQIDLFARFGGEEFIVLLPETPLATALQVAERLRQLLEQTPLTIAGKSVPVRASFGCVSSRAGDVSQLLNLADKAMYRAKADGRNQVRLAPEREPDS